MGFDWCCDCGFVVSICSKWLDHLDYKNPSQIYIHMMFHNLRPHLHMQKIWVIGWREGTVVVWMLYRALNDVERVCCSVELIQFVSCASAPLLCWISFLLSLLCLYPSEREKATNHQHERGDQRRAGLSILSSYGVNPHTRACVHTHIAAVCIVWWLVC